MITMPQPDCSALDEGLQNHKPVVICTLRRSSEPTRSVDTMYYFEHVGP